MTKEEKSVLAACNRHFNEFLKDGTYGRTDAEVITSQRDYKGTRVQLVRAVAKWRKATGKSKA